jgi:hypothetical protein
MNRFYEGTHTLHTFAFNTNVTSVTDNRPLLAEGNESLKFTRPLDVTVQASAVIYVADAGAWRRFGTGGAIWALKPHLGK